ncbi:pre-mRNA-splicing factor prp46 [Puttea exsequens]|nr:pre-mRNA-splicing factor prp46 [Puttea exsequens]
MAADTSLSEILVRTSAQKTRDLFGSDYTAPEPSFDASPNDPTVAAARASRQALFRAEYQDVQELPAALAAKQPTIRRKKPKTDNMIDGISEKTGETDRSSSALTLRKGGAPGALPNGAGRQDSSSLIKRENIQQVKPEWHSPWELMRVISGHLGWVRALAVEPNNQWIASGAGDRTIKIWDLASGSLRLTLTGHISTVRGLAVSPRHPYLFSCGEDKMVKCWDLETNKVIRHYHGHLSGVYTLHLHPTLDILATGGRDGVVRVWDMRSRSNIHVLSGHRQTVSDIICQAGAEPQIISGSLDSTVRLYDLTAGKTMGVLTHHKKGVRALAQHPIEWTFASGSTSSIKQWKCPEGAFMQNFDAQNSIINTLSTNEDGVMFAGGDNGSMAWFDWKSGHRYQMQDSVAQPGSLDAEAGIFASIFDRTGLRLITGEADKTIKVWRQNPEATPETHPLDWKPALGRSRY